MAQILKSNKIFLSVAANEKDAFFVKNGKPYFLSFSRRPLKPNGRPFECFFVADRTKLKHNYTIDPVDYFRDSFSMRRSEAEDRLYTNEPMIENATSYILEIHAFTDSGFTKQHKVQASKAAVSLQL